MPAGSMVVFTKALKEELPKEDLEALPTVPSAFITNT
jgi:hypothetical protein